VIPESFLPIDRSTGPISVPQTLPLFVLSNAVPYPRIPLVVTVSGTVATNVALIESLLERVAHPIGLMSRCVVNAAVRKNEHRLGCVGRLLAIREDAGTYQALFRCGPLFETNGLVEHEELLVARAEQRAEVETPAPEVMPDDLAVLREIADATLAADFGERTAARNWIDAMNDPRDLASLCMHPLEMSLEDQQDLLAQGADARLRCALRMLVGCQKANAQRELLLSQIRADKRFPR
jgi:hypothetical protein